MIVFDIGNVLLRFDLDVAARNFERLDPGKGRDLAETLWSPPTMNRFETGRISGPDLFTRLKKRFGLKMSFKGFHGAFTPIFTPIRENIALFRRFTLTRRVALLSNVNEIHWEFIRRKYPVLKRAHVPCASHQMGVMKPHRKAYETVAARAGVPLRGMVYVDDREDLIRAARRLGITSIHFTGARRLEEQFKDVGVD